MSSPCYSGTLDWYTDPKTILISLFILLLFPPIPTPIPEGGRGYRVAHGGGGVDFFPSSKIATCNSEVEKSVCLSLVLQQSRGKEQS